MLDVVVADSAVARELVGIELDIFMNSRKSTPCGSGLDIFLPTGLPSKAVDLSF